MHALAHLGPSDAMGVEVDARCTDSADRARDSARANSGFCYSGSCFCCCCAVAQPTRAHARAPHLRRRPRALASGRPLLALLVPIDAVRAAVLRVLLLLLLLLLLRLLLLWLLLLWLCVGAHSCRAGQLLRARFLGVLCLDAPVASEGACLEHRLRAALAESQAPPVQALAAPVAAAPDLAIWTAETAAAWARLPHDRCVAVALVELRPASALLAGVLTRGGAAAHEGEEGRGAQGG